MIGDRLRAAAVRGRTASPLRLGALSLLVVLLAAASPSAAAQGGPEPPTTRGEAELLFRQANDAFLSGEPSRARALYRAVADGGYGTADVWFNLGNAALETGRLGEAVLAYERALRLDPMHDGARTNLDIARARNVDQLVGAGEGASFGQRVARVLPVGVVTWAFVGAWLVLFAGLAAVRLFGGGPWRTAGLAAWMAFTLFLGTLLATVVWYREQVEEGVVMDEVAAVREGPAPRYSAAFEVHEGLKLRLLDTDGPYVRVRLDNGLEGWVLRRAVEAI